MKKHRCQNVARSGSQGWARPQGKQAICHRPAPEAAPLKSCTLSLLFFPNLLSYFPSRFPT